MKCQRCGMPLFGKKAHGFVEGFEPRRRVGIRVCGDKEDCAKHAESRATRR